MSRQEDFSTESAERIPDPRPAEKGRERMERARNIVKEGGYDKAIAILKEEGLLETVIQETKKKYLEEDSPHYESGLASAKFLTDEDWQLIASMDIFDPETVEHEIRVFNLAHDHLEKAAFVPVKKKNVEGNEYEAGYGLSLDEVFEHEGVLKEHFLRAALHHDIGKMDVPPSVLMNRTTDEDWKHIISLRIGLGDASLSQTLSETLGVDADQMFQGSEGRADFEEKIAALMKEKNFRAKDIIPLRYALSEREADELAEKGFPPDSTLADIIRVHEERSGDILRKAGFATEAELAENHHNYRAHDLRDSKDINKPISIGTLVLNVCLADVLHIADVEQAMQAKRAYKRALGPFETWSTICELAEQGKVSKEAAYLWIKAEIDEKGKEAYANTKEEQPGRQEHVERFLLAEEDAVWKNLDELGYGAGSGKEKGRKSD
ncbi:MAG: hypothetical protein WCT49_03235 [Candidatus Paceibacterota bacterium]|jgi:hypothetical protein|nr:hypothetical protein [Candidatus Paceibacterota bacterium]